MQFHFTAVRAFKNRGDVAFKRHAAAFAERRSDEADLGPAFRADKTALGRGAFRFANPADFRIKKSEAGVEPASDWRGNRTHGGIVKRCGVECKLILPAKINREQFLFAPDAIA